MDVYSTIIRPNIDDSELKQKIKETGIVLSMNLKNLVERRASKWLGSEKDAIKTKLF